MSTPGERLAVEVGEQWQDADRGIWRYQEHEGKRVTVRADAEYLNALEARAALLERMAEAVREKCRWCAVKHKPYMRRSERRLVHHVREEDISEYCQLSDSDRDLLAEYDRMKGEGR